MRTIGVHQFPAMERVVFGKPAAEAVSAEADRAGSRRAFLIVSRTLNTKTQEIAKIRAALGDRFAGLYDRVPQHTSRQGAVAATQAALAAGTDLVIAVGGGSVIDAAKITLICMEHNITDPDGLDGFELKIGPDRQPMRPDYRGPSIRMIAVPSTLSGGEYNAGCLVTDARRRLKQTFFHPLMMPRTIILDPVLAMHAPEALWVGSGTRAMDHAIEALCSPSGTPLVDAVVSQGIELMASALPRSKAAPADVDARRECQIASWLCSYGLQSRVPMGASHAIGHVLGGTSGVSHYLCTPVMMPSILRFNRPVTEEAQRVLAKALGRADGDAATEFGKFVTGLGLPTRLRDVGVTNESFELIARTTMSEFFIYTNPRRIRGWEDVLEILQQAA